MSTIRINSTEVIGNVAPEIFGHFAEHIGGVIYDGIWVGKDSDIPNVEGFRLDAIEKVRAIHPPVIRWPGGCFTETYNWRDGIGKNRPTRLSWWTKDDGRYETNEFGTHEFLRFCELVGAKPYIAVKRKRRALYNRIHELPVLHIQPVCRILLTKNAVLIIIPPKCSIHI